MIIPPPSYHIQTLFTSAASSSLHLSLMESLSIGLSSSPKNPKTHKLQFNPNPISNSNPTHLQFTTKKPQSTKTHFKFNLKPQSLLPLFTTFQFPLSSLAIQEPIPTKFPFFLSGVIQEPIPTNQLPSKINLEPILVSIDNFFTKFPFFVSGVIQEPIPTNQLPSKINLEPILVSIDNFFNKFPFLVSGVIQEPIPINQTPSKIDLEPILVSIDNFFTKFPFFVSGVIQEPIPTNQLPSKIDLEPILVSIDDFFKKFPFLVSGVIQEPIPTNQTPSKIDLEAILVSIDDFFNKYPFFVAGVVFIWLFVVPATEEYLRKYKFISALDAFKKLKEDPNAQLLDIRDGKTLRVLGSPNLKVFGKEAVQVEFKDGGKEFVERVNERFREPADTVVCVLDNFDGESMKVAELLFKNGFKEAYAIKGGVRGSNGWLEIQETLLPPSVHITLKRKVKKSTEAKNNGAIEQQSVVKSQPASVAEIKQTDNGYVTTAKEPKTRSSSPYPMYPDMKPPSSPTPSKPQ